MPAPLTDPDDIRRYSNALRLQSERRMKALTQQMVDGKMSLADWQQAMKKELRRGNLEQFVTGKGGNRGAIDRKEYLQLGPELKRQYRYLQRFADEIARRAENGMGLDFAIERANLYAKSTQASMWRSAVPVKLPQVPRDGSTACRTNCKCRIQFDYERDELGAVIAVLVYWLLRPAEHCIDCLELSRSWNPKRIPIEESMSSIEQAVGLLLMEVDDAAERREISEMWEIEESWAFH